MFLREFAVFPTWIIYRTLFQVVLRKSHPWRTMPRVGLENWAARAKPFLIELGICFWVSNLCSIYLISFLIKEYLR